MRLMDVLPSRHCHRNKTPIHVETRLPGSSNLSLCILTCTVIALQIYSNHDVYLSFRSSDENTRQDRKIQGIMEIRRWDILYKVQHQSCLAVAYWQWIFNTYRWIMCLLLKHSFKANILESRETLLFSSFTFQQWNSNISVEIASGIKKQPVI